jgi:tetraacyldisaccharide 4'-kinase
MKSLLLPPLSALYGAVTRTRLSLYQRGTFHTTKLDRPVISVGNITVGGTGKTPLVEWIAKTIAARGKNVCILTRGYGRENPQRQVVVSDGENILATPSEAGDEPYLLATKLLGSAAVISNIDRLSAGRYAIENLRADCFVLDDGFQHLRLARDLNIVTIDAAAPWGDPWGGGKLLPFGRLRESPSGLSRADCVVLTRCDQAPYLGSLEAELPALTHGRPVFLSTMKPVKDLLRTGPVAAFCAIGNPRSFFSQLHTAGYEVVHEKTYGDHHSYTQRDVDHLLNEATRAGATNLITTAKDAVKLRSLSFTLPWHVFEIEIAIKNEDDFRRLIFGVL